MFPWSVIATDFCPSAATRSMSLETSQAPSRSEYSVCRCRCVNSAMAYYYFTGKHLHDIRLKTGPQSPCGRSSQSGVILSTARLGPHGLREGGHPSLLFNHPEMWVGGWPTFKSTARLGAHPCVARVGKTT